jgi:hypothetical protein
MDRLDGQQEWITAYWAAFWDLEFAVQGGWNRIGWTCLGKVHIYTYIFLQITFGEENKSSLQHFAILIVERNFVFLDLLLDSTCII